MKNQLNRVLPIIILITLFLQTTQAKISSPFSEYYNLSSTDGRILNAKIEKFGVSDVLIALANNSRYTVPYIRFDQATQDKLHQLWAQELNSKLNIDIFPLDGGQIGEMPMEKWAEFAQIKTESQTSYDSSYRNYLKDKQILGSEAYTISAYAKAAGAEYQQLKQLSIIFANKGDSVKPIETYPGMLQSTFDDLQKELRAELIQKIKEATAPIQQQLEAWFGESTRMEYGYGSQKEYADRWDSKGYSFLLNIKRDELVSLKIMPTNIVEQQNKQVETNPQELISRIITNDFGDVFLGDMPMVNQGPKGYCFPATCERMMRYLGIEADMYTWAMAGETAAGSGTNPEDMIPKISNYLVQKSNNKLRKINFNKLKHTTRQKMNA